MLFPCLYTFFLTHNLPLPSLSCSQDVEDKVQKTFPTPIDKVRMSLKRLKARPAQLNDEIFMFFTPQWALKDAHETIDKTKKKKSVLPVERMHTILQKVSWNCHIVEASAITLINLMFTCVLGTFTTEN